MHPSFRTPLNAATLRSYRDPSCEHPFRAAIALVLQVGQLICVSLLSANAAAMGALQDETETDRLKRSAYSKVSDEEEQDFVRIGDPKPGEWLSQFPEAGQSMERYKSRDSRILANPMRRIFVLQPLGVFTESQLQLVEELRDYAQVYFQLPSRVASTIALPEPERSKLGRMLPKDRRRDNYDRQYDATNLVNKLLLPNLPKDAVVYIGITMEDLYAEDMNYVFGFGSFQNRTGVYSLARYFPEFWGEPTNERSEHLARRRSFKVLNHEASHVFGLKHCIFYDCTMNGSNSLEEADRSSIHECPVCHQKLLWNLKFEPQKRFDALRTLYAKYGMDEESAWMTKRSEHWKQIHDPVRAKR